MTEQHPEDVDVPEADDELVDFPDAPGEDEPLDENEPPADDE